MDFNITLGARKKNINFSIIKVINLYKRNYKAFKNYNGSIDSIYGFAEYTPLYGGRLFEGQELSDSDIKIMYDLGIGFRIPLQNYFITDELYNDEKPFLEKYHREGNSIITFNDSFVEKIRNDFPKYKIECSVLKDVKNLAQIRKTLELYDTVVPNPKEFDLFVDWSKISEDEKNRIRLFLTHFCFYDCKVKTCHNLFSERNINMSGTYKIEQTESPSLCETGDYIFPKKEIDITKYIMSGFRNFKAYHNF